MKIKKAKLFIPPLLTKDEHFKKQLKEINTKFNNSKRSFQKIASHCFKEIVEMQILVVHIELCQHIIKGFL